MEKKKGCRTGSELRYGGEVNIRRDLVVVVVVVASSIILLVMLQPVSLGYCRFAKTEFWLPYW
jgi:hypothetical protein